MTAAQRTLSWPTVVVLVVCLLSLVGTVITALLTNTDRTLLLELVAGEAAFFATVLAFMRGVLHVAAVLLLVLVASSASACGSSAAAAGAGLNTPNHAELVIDASDGGTVIMGASCRPVARSGGTDPRTLLECDGEGSPVQIWQDNRSGGSEATLGQSGTEIKTRLALQAQVAAGGRDAAASDPSQSADGEDDEEDEPSPPPARATGGR